MTPEEEIAALKQQMRDHLDAWNYIMPVMRTRVAVAEKHARKMKNELKTVKAWVNSHVAADEAWNDALNEAIALVDDLPLFGRSIDAEMMRLVDRLRLLKRLRRPPIGLLCQLTQDQQRAALSQTICP